MFDRIQSAVLRSALAGAVLATLVFGASDGRAMALPPGLASNCTLSGCIVRYWDPEPEDEFEAPGNGHYYGFVPVAAPVMWTDASFTARHSTLGEGSVGYLATLVTEAEQNFVLSALLLPPGGYDSNKHQVWLGGVQDAEATLPTVGWDWDTPPSIIPELWDYTNWTPGEPNDDDGMSNERFLSMWVTLFRNSQDQRGKWNDEDNVAAAAAPIVGMLIEWEAPDFDVPVPEPGTGALVALGAAGLFGLRRRARR